MIGAARYSAALTASRAKLAELLEPSAWERLLDADSVERAAEILQPTPYGAALPSDACDADRVEHAVERVFSRMLYAPVPFLRAAERRLYEMMWRSLELEDLLILLRGIHNDVSPGRIRASLKPLGGVTALDWRRLAQAPSMDALVDRLAETDAGSYYARFLVQALHEYHRRDLVSLLETSVNLGYYRDLRRTTEALRGAPGRDARRLVGFALDSRLLLWAARYRVFLRLSPEEIMGATLHRGFRTQPEHVQRIANGADIVEIVAEIWGEETGDTDALMKLSPRDRIVQLELAFRRRRNVLAQQSVTGYPFRFGALLAHAILLQDDAHDIITLVEAAAEQWPPRRASEQLIGRRRADAAAR